MYDDLPKLKQHKLYLQDFWREFAMTGPGRRGYSRKSRERTIVALCRLAEIDLDYQTVYTSRAQFEKRKNTRKKFTGFKYCFACRGPAQVRHHIIMLKHGGRNQSNNVLALCRSCHADIHPWLQR